MSNDAANGTPVTVGQPVVQDLYREAVSEGGNHYLQYTTRPSEPLPVRLGPDGPGYWIARYAARKATDALLLEARRIGVTEEQWESLRAKAAEVAYD